MKSWRSIGVGVVVCVMSLCGTAFAQPFTSFETYYTFSNSRAFDPRGRPVVAPDGSLYGTTNIGGVKRCDVLSAPGCGTVYRITPDGRLNVLHAFNGADGAFPDAGLTFGADGNLYGVTREGGALSGGGTVFRITLAGVLTTLHVFTGGADGASPSAALVRAADGTLYGTTTGGGDMLTCRGGACGTIFKIATDGTFATLHRFPLMAKQEGWSPVGSLAIGADGNVYGLTRLGGAGVCMVGARDFGCGTVFRMTPAGVFTTIHSFAEVVAGQLPEPVDLQFDPADNGLLGTMRTEAGIALFRLTLTGTLTMPYVFPDGAYTLILSGDGNLYGYGLGRRTVFRLTPGLAHTILHEFASEPGGLAGLSLTQSASGDFVGIAEGGGGPKCTTDPLSGCTTAFRLGMFDDADAPNLSIRSFKAARRMPVGATFTLTATTANRGTASAGPSETTYWLSATGALGGAQLLALEALPAIPAGQGLTRVTTVTLPPVGPGRYDLIARADSSEAVHEAYEADNTKRRLLVIGPDLAIHRIFPSGPGLSVDPPSPISTGPTAVSVHTANLGGDVAQPSTTHLYRSATRKLNAHAVLLATISNPQIGPEEHNHVVFSLTLPSGSYFLVAVADAIGAIEEANEDNNSGVLPVIVQ